MTITCPRCSLAFETRATTATRCPSCRAVVHISRGTSSARSRSSQMPHRAAQSYDYSDPGEAGGAVVIVAVVAFGGWLVWQWWRGRRPRTNETGLPAELATGPYTFARPTPTFAHDGPLTERAPFATTARHAATRAHTGPDSTTDPQVTEPTETQ